MRKIFYFFPLLILVLLSACSSTGVNQLKQYTVTDTVSAEEFLDKTPVDLDVKDVEDNEASNQDKLFKIEGNAQLDDYYNYGFDDEDKYFSVSVIPFNTEIDGWNVYFQRDKYQEFYQDLKDNPDMVVKIIGIIPHNLYEDGQSNVAGGAYVEYKN
ncbi:hypothetical protein ACDN41_12730 [Priestia aryabhattai]|uniref:hypothetical protein n=1 Tax=Priestia aryabhattai TaxID=412384 RepID=UPI0035325E2C